MSHVALLNILSTMPEKTIDAEIIKDFIASLEIPPEAKEELYKLTPANYIGDAIKLARDI